MVQGSPKQVGASALPLQKTHRRSITAELANELLFF